MNKTKFMIFSNEHLKIKGNQMPRTKSALMLITTALVTIGFQGCSETKQTVSAYTSPPITIETHIAELKETLSAKQIPFKSLDQNKDKLLTAKEFTGSHPDIFTHVDKTYDGALSEKEYKAYSNAQKKIIQEKEKIPAGTLVYNNIPYTSNPHHRQYLDLYMPANADTSKPIPLVIWVHGGGWRQGSKIFTGQQTRLVNKSFAVAAINYRLSKHAPYPAQLHDCKAALRYLRKHAANFGIDPDRIGVWGSSAGGHLVALMGTTGDEPAFEGNVGVTGVSSKVQAVNDWYGPTEMFKMYDLLKSQEPEGSDLSEFPIPKLFGGMPGEKDDLIKEGSPIFQVDADNPPFLIMHADGDLVVPLEQSTLFQKELDRHNVPNEMHIIDMDKHAFFRGKREENIVHNFFIRTLKEK